MKNAVIPAIIAKTQPELDGIFQKIGLHARLVQLDVMDGRFVPSRSLDFDFELPAEGYEYEAHLMVEDQEDWIIRKGENVHTVIVHLESVENPQKTINLVKSLGKKVAFALNPETGVDRVRAYLEDLDQVLIMTVNPGFYGSPFLPEALEKIPILRRWRPDLNIEVDGGIKPETIGLAARAGANLFVSGSYLIQADDLPERMDILKSKIQTP